MERQFRIRTNVGKDTVVNVNLKQDVDFLDILSLKLNTTDTYRLMDSGYGVIVGRVLGNETFGIENAKVSIFIAVDSDDKFSEDLYPYTSTRSFNSDGIRYNLLPEEQVNKNHTPVGTFPSKRLVLDDDSYLEVYDKYWKYTTCTNKSGDYMIFGVPQGSQTLHVDIDLSDIGMLSQKPSDFMYKGYSLDMFESPTKFKSDTSIDGLPQIFSQDTSVYVHPFWGQSTNSDIAITRCDINIQYKFEPTCVFMGSIFSDDENNAIEHDCKPTDENGLASKLVPGSGVIETIRKNVNGEIEELVIQGNQLIDGNGVWCYQIPMNLDYISTDEYGNIVPSEMLQKGIPTRARVRFRFTMNDSGDEGQSRHRAKYLVPNNPPLARQTSPSIDTDAIETGEPEDYYEFGDKTPDDCFRDLLWNKVYTVKNYIPRIQKGVKDKSKRYSGIKSINASDNSNNPVPFNKLRIYLPWKYRLICVLYKALISVMGWVNHALVWIDNKPGLKANCFGIEAPFTDLSDTSIGNYNDGLDYPIESQDEAVSDVSANIAQGAVEQVWAPGCYNDPLKRLAQDEWHLRCNYQDQRCVTTDRRRLMMYIEYGLAGEYDIYNLDFYNDWINGSLYAPLWFWKKMNAQRGWFGTWLFGHHSVNQYCNCEKQYKRIAITELCELEYENEKLQLSDNVISNTPANMKDVEKSKKRKNWHKSMGREKPSNGVYGIIKNVKNAQGVDVYYYSNGFSYENNGSFIRYFSTDLVLLGSLDENDINGIPLVSKLFPPTSSNIAPLLPVEDYVVVGDTVREGEHSYFLQEESGIVVASGLDFGFNPEGHTDEIEFQRGLLADIGCSTINTLPKSCVNVERMSELGVNRDTMFSLYNQNESVDILPDGMITSLELDSKELRSSFATMNFNKLNVVSGTSSLSLGGYNTYKLRYCPTQNFDGRISDSTTLYTSAKHKDNQDDEYMTYRFGATDNSKSDGTIRHFYHSKEEVGDNYYSFPLYENSFYMFFGIKPGSTAIDKFNEKFTSNE